ADANLALYWGITDRLQLQLPSPALAYRFGDAPGIEWVPWGGMTSWGLAGSNVGTADGGAQWALQYRLGAGLDTRFTVGSTASLIVGLSTASGIVTIQKEGQSGACASGCPIENPHTSPNTWAAVAKVGYSTTLGEVVTLNVGLSGSVNYLFDGKSPGPGE